MPFSTEELQKIRGSVTSDPSFSGVSQTVTPTSQSMSGDEWSKWADATYIDRPFTGDIRANTPEAANARAKTGFHAGEAIKGSIDRRKTNIDETTRAYTEGKIGLPQAFANNIGQVLGLAFDMPMDVAGSVIKKTGIGQHQTKSLELLGQKEVTDYLTKKLADPLVSTYDTAGKLSQHAGDLYQQAHAEQDPERKQRLLDLAKQTSDMANSVKENADKIDTSYQENAKTGEAGINAALLIGGEGAKPAIDEAVNIGKKTASIAGDIGSSGGDLLDKMNPLKITAEKQAKSVDSLEADYSKWAGQTKTGVKTIGKVEKRTEALNQAGTTGKTPQRTLAESGIIPQTEKTKFRTFDQANQFRESLGPLNDALDSGLKEVDMATEGSKLADLEAEAVRNIRETRKPAGEIESMVADARREFALLKEKYGETIKASDMGIEKRNYSGGVKFDTTKPLQDQVYYNIRKSFQKNIENTAENAGFKDVAQLNREIGDRLNAADFLQKLDGQTLKYGKIGKYVFMGIGASLGHGIVGKVMGVMGGELLADFLMKADVAMPIKRMVLKSLEQKSPEAYQATLEWMKQQGLDRELRLALPAPSYMEMGAKGAEPMKAPTAKAISVKNPKTGKYEKAYTSEAKPEKGKYYENTSPSGIKYTIEPQ